MIAKAPSSKRVTPIVEVRNLSKTFAAHTVLREVDFTVRPGEIHGLLGHNGSGKSTLIKVLCGVYAPDPGGALVVCGEPVRLPLRPRDRSRLGIAVVHQDLALAESMTVMENLLAGRYETQFAWRVSWPRERMRTSDALVRFGLDISPDARISTLDEVARAKVAILRAFNGLMDMRRGQALLILDEPTAHLPQDSAQQLFKMIKNVAATGVGVIFITHRLGEVQAISDRVSILRDGALVDTVRTSAITERRLVELIVGRSLAEPYAASHNVRGEVVFAAEGVSDRIVQDFSLRLRHGEILGLTGLAGMGHERIPYLLFGAVRASRGTVRVGGRTYDLRRMVPRDAKGAGLALLPGNRLRDGAVGSATVGENVSLAILPSFVSRGRLDRRSEAREVSRLLAKFDVRPADPQRIFGTLSGGNQQKALIAKWFETDAQILLLHEPTHGVDVGARREILRHIRDAAVGGRAVILATSAAEDLANLCDRVLVVRDGRPVKELYGGLSEDRISEECCRER